MTEVNSSIDHRQRAYTDAELATRSRRLIAAWIDAVIMGAAVSMAAITNLTAAVPIVLIVLGAQVAALTDLGQTMGKMVTGITIVDADTRRAVSARRSVWLRFVLTGILSTVTLGVFGLIDNLAIFREDRRCIHDQLANTVVVRN